MKSDAARASILLIIASLCWGGNIVLGRAIAADVPPLGLSFWRWMAVAIILIIFNARQLPSELPLVRKQWRLIALLSLTGMTIFHSTQYVALNTTTAVNVALIVAVSPLLVPLLARVILKTPVSGREVAGILLSFLGLIIVVTKGQSSALAALTFTSGDLFMLIGACSWTVYTVLLKRKPAQLTSLTLLTWASTFAAICLLPLYLWESNFGGRIVELNSTTLISIAYTAIFASLAGFFFFNGGVATLGPAKSASYAHLIPVFATLLAVIFLGEKLHFYHLLGMLAIGAGIAITTKAKPVGALQ